MAGVLYCTLNTVWARNRNHSEDSKRVSTITDRQTERQRCTDRLGQTSLPPKTMG